MRRLSFAAGAVVAGWLWWNIINRGSLPSAHHYPCDADACWRCERIRRQ